MNSMNLTLHEISRNVKSYVTLIWVMNLENYSENRPVHQDRPQKFRLKYQDTREYILRKSIFKNFSSRSPPINFVQNSRAHVISLIENRSFHQYRPTKIRSKYLQIAPKARAAPKMFEDAETFCYHVNVFPKLEMDIFFPTIDPKARAARKFVGRY